MIGKLQLVQQLSNSLEQSVPFFGIGYLRRYLHGVYHRAPGAGRGQSAQCRRSRNSLEGITTHRTHDARNIF